MPTIKKNPWGRKAVKQTTCIRTLKLLRRRQLPVLPPPIATTISMRMRAKSQPGPQNTGPHRLPCHAMPKQDSAGPAAARRARTPSLSGLWLTHAQRKRTDDDESPLPWLCGFCSRAKSSRWRPDTAGLPAQRGTARHGHPLRQSPCTATRTVASQGETGKKNWGAASVCGRCSVDKKGVTRSQSLTTLHTTPHPELSPIACFRSSCSLALECSPAVRSRELELLQPWRFPCFSCCCWPCSQAQVSELRICAA